MNDDRYDDEGFDVDDDVYMSRTYVSGDAVEINDADGDAVDDGQFDGFTRADICNRALSMAVWNERKPL